MQERLCMRNLCIFFLSAFILCSCEELFEAHPYDGKITGETGMNAKNIARIVNNCAGKQQIRFIMMGDTQRWYDETEDFVSHINSRNDIDFVIHGGDISDFGLTKEMLWQRNILNKLKVPYVVLLGNHDCLATGEQVFRKVFGDENFAFVAGNIRFVCLNTNSLEYDYSHPVPDFDFIDEQLTAQATEEEKTIVVMHSPPFSDQFDNNIAPFFQEEIIKFSNLQFCLNAHEHRLEVKDRFKDGIIYYGSANIEKRNYLLFTITPNGYEREVVYF
ncbi:MAG: metallophosphoesterase [Prevotellaceae bacterium]|jgi:predicted phosphodiesterase|nr:metallophosphoesterase [Prevotellaceae bacterium]